MNTTQYTGSTLHCFNMQVRDLLLCISEINFIQTKELSFAENLFCNYLNICVVFAL